MALVTVTYNAWDANKTVIPAINEPEVWLRPLATSLVSGMLSDREVKGSLNAISGAGSVRVESATGLFYVPILRWLKNPEDPGNRARGQTEWEAFFPGAGGNISDLRIYTPSPGDLFHGYGPPPASITYALYVDRSGVNPVLWGPQGGGI